MAAHRVLVAEALPLQGDAVQGQLGGVEGVDPLFGEAGGVGLAAFELDGLVDKDVGGAVHDDGVVLGIGVAVVTQGHVDVLKSADADELALAAAVAGLPLFAQAVFVVDVHKLLRRGGHKDHIAVEGLFDLGHAQGQGRADGGGQLGVVSAAVGGASLGVGVFVVGNGQGIQFADDSHGGAGGALGL